MPKEKLKTIYVCTQCGETSPRWLGRCPSCGAWNTMTEDVVAEPAKTASGKAAAAPRVAGQTSLVPQKLKSISTTEEKSRIVTGISELDRVLGGGIVIGSVTLIGGEPGIGNPRFCCSSAARSAKPKMCCMSQARNPSARSSCGPSGWMCRRTISHWSRRAMSMRFAA